MAEEKEEIGVATGLAWTEVGGEILVTEATLMPGRGHLTLTGKLGDVMQESAQAAMSWVRSKADEFGIPKDFNKKTDVHIHVPEGAIPKDGPSAGITLATALVSALARVPTRTDVAMTGEITLRGKVLPIGGVKEKVLAAHRAGIKTIIMPKDNEKDLADIPKNVLDTLNMYLVGHMDEVLKIAMAGPMPAAICAGSRRRRKSKSRPTTRSLTDAMKTADRPAYALITAAWVMAVLLVSPTGNFPITDDWSYAFTVRSLIVDGEWHLHDWTSMQLATQVIWGALFAWVFGISYETLRASTLVLAWLASLGVYTLMRRRRGGLQAFLLRRLRCLRSSFRSHSRL